MKVKELIEELTKMDQNLEVVVNDTEWGYFPANKPKVITNIITGGIFSNTRQKLKKAIQI